MATDTHKKIVIIGSGPAAWTAAIYAGRAQLEPVVYEGNSPGGQLMTTTDVDNFPGFPDGINGYELVERMRTQALKYGTTAIAEQITAVDFSVCPFVLHTETSTIHANAVIIATGASANRLQFPGAEAYWNKGISACAVCDGASPIFRGKPLVVIGGGDSAMEEATFLTKFASRVYIVYRGSTLRASKIMIAKAEANPKIEFVYNTTVTEALGDNELLQSVRLSSGAELKCNGLFFAVGHTPSTSVFKDEITLDSQGYIITKPNSTCTSVPGVFACGDVQDSKWRQAITAAGSGCMAALEAETWLSSVET